ncbi:putative quinol monooxygenase [Acetobacter sp. DsW_063]|uniref:putative quinol monooxygenase n=1 Tax=Acetobacter sp. DsW_063 TaxID=1514894 RepID=UPI000A381F0C|nr:antibiotic biosynthesis monooxygenase [Acetobacter sp. DsW_063]OUJ11066.1 hypothetical protein HK28_04785 [Acetobacter sp. DsW_063]
MFYRKFRYLVIVAISTPALAAPTTGAFHSIVNVDLMPSDQVEGEKLLANYRDQVKNDPNVQSIDLIQQAGDASNHFILTETFASETAYRRFIQSEAVRRFRTALYPHLGSPWDERLGSEQLR